MPESQSVIIIKAKDFASRVIGKLNKRLTSLAAAGMRRVIGAGKTLAKVMAVAVVAAFGLAMRAAAKFDATMGEVSTLLSGKAKDAVEGLSAAVLEMSTRLPKTADDLGAGLYQVYSAGVTDAADAVSVLEISAKAAIAGISSTLTSVDVITTVLNAYGLSAGRANQVADVLFQTVKDGKITFNQLAGATGDVVSSAALAGVSFEEVAAAFATMTKAGIGADEAATSLNRLILSMLEPMDDAAEAAEGMGLAWDITALRANGLIGQMDALNKATNGNVGALKKVVPELRAFRAAAILAGTGAKTYQQLLVNARNASGAMSEAFEDMNKRAHNQWQLLKNRLNVVLIETGDVILPKFTKAMITAGGPVERLRDLLRDNEENVEAFAGAMANMVPVIIAFIGWIGKLAITLGDLAKTWNDIIDPADRFARGLIQFQNIEADKTASNFAEALKEVADAERGVERARDIEDKAEATERLANAQEDLNRVRLEELDRLERLVDARTADIDEAQAAAAAQQALIDQFDERDTLASLLTRRKGDFANLRGLNEAEEREKLKELNAEVVGLTRAYDNAVVHVSNFSDVILGASRAAAAAAEDLSAAAGGKAPVVVDEVKEANKRLKDMLDKVAEAERQVIFAADLPSRLAAEERLRRAKAKALTALHEEVEVLKASGLAGDELAKTLNNVARAMSKIGAEAGTIDDRIAAALGAVNAGLRETKDAVEAVEAAQRAVALASTEEERTAATEALVAAHKNLRDVILAQVTALTNFAPKSAETVAIITELLGLLDKFGQKAEEVAKTFDEAFQVALGNIAATFAGNFARAVSKAFAALVEGSISAGEAFAKAMLGALAAVAQGFGQFFIARAIAAVAALDFRAAGLYIAAATAMFALSGVLSGFAGGIGGGGGGASPAAQATTAEDTQRPTVLIIEGGFLDMTDPRQEQQFARALREISGRDVIVRGSRAGAITTGGS